MEQMNLWKKEWTKEQINGWNKGKKSRKKNNKLNANEPTNAFNKLKW